MTSLVMSNFGNIIKEHRRLKKLTLTQLAAKLNLDSANLSKIENGIREFDEDYDNSTDILYKAESKVQYIKEKKK